MRRPLGVTILLWLVLSLSAWGGLRLVTAIRWWDTLLEFVPAPGPLYIAISGGIGLLSGMLLLWGIWQANAWIRYALLGTGVIFIAWYWGDRLIFRSSNANWPFALLASIILLIVLTACILMPSTKTFLSQREAND